MRRLLIILFISVSFIKTLAQDRIVLISQYGHVIDTLNSQSLYSINGDTLTRFLKGKSSSPDRCSSFSITREKYKRKGVEFLQIQKRKIVINSTCSNFLTDDNVYCLRLIDFKFKNGTVTVVITDSSNKKLKAKLKGDSDFEIQLKEKLDKFISKVECNGVRIE